MVSSQLLFLLLDQSYANGIVESGKREGEGMFC